MCVVTYSPGRGRPRRGGDVLSVFTHFLVQFDWRQHLSPRGHTSSDSQPDIDAHPGMGFRAGHEPGLVPENTKINNTVINAKLASASDQVINILPF